MLSAIVAAFHFLALALGLPAIFLRGRALHRLPDRNGFGTLFPADNCWGVAALLWIVTGFWRVFGGLEKGATFYLDSRMFWIKMGLFGCVLLLEIYPMITLMRWRIRMRRGGEPDLRPLPTLRILNALELAIVLAIPFVASLMARGFGQPES